MSSMLRVGDSMRSVLLGSMSKVLFGGCNVGGDVGCWISFVVQACVCVIVASIHACMFLSASGMEHRACCWRGRILKEGGRSIALAG